MKKKSRVGCGWPAEISPLVASPSLDYVILNGCLFRLREPGSSDIQSLQNPLIRFRFPAILCTPLGICLGSRGDHLAVGAAWKCDKCGDESGPESDDSDSDGGSDGGSGSDSDSDSDSNSDGDSSYAAELPNSFYVSTHFRLLVYNSSKLEEQVVSFCSHSRANDDENTFRYTSPVFNPTRPLIAWAPGPGEIILANYETGDREIQRTAKMSQSSHVIATGKHDSSMYIYI